MSDVFKKSVFPCLILLISITTFSCASSTAGPDESDGDLDLELDGDRELDDEGELEAEAPAPSAIEAFYQELQGSAWSFPVEAGDWAEDFGDAAYYALAYYINAGYSESREDYIDRAVQAKDRNIAIVEHSKDDIAFFLDNLEELMMAELGIIEYMFVTGDTAPLAVVDEFLDRSNSTFESFGVYIEIELGSYALETYGPTAIAGVLILMNLRYAEMLDNERRQERIDFAERIMATIEEKAFMDEFYRFNSESEKLYLYPNIIMTLSNCIAYKLTGKEGYKSRALQLYQAIQGLRAPEGNRYYSPYSAEYMGAKTENYTTLSSMNYTILALAMLYEISGDAAFLEEIELIVSFIHDYLYQPEDGRILHHWMDGKLAVPEDPEYYCSGCNFQFLYALWYMMNRLDVED